ncbi:MAG TPA: hypothetical protein VF183_01120 [Acidimicrobiales bacterium]
MSDDVVARGRGSTSRHGRGPAVARWPAVVLIVALLVAAGLVGSNDDGSDFAAPDTVLDPSGMGPTIGSSESLGSFWFCAGGTGVPNGAADHTVVILNTTGEERRVDVVVYGSRPAGGEPPAPASVALAAKPYPRERPSGSG